MSKSKVSLTAVLAGIVSVLLCIDIVAHAGDTAFKSKGKIVVGNTTIFDSSDFQNVATKEDIGDLKFRSESGKGQYSTDNGLTWKNFRQPTGNATAANVLSGKTFANSSSDSMTGTMPDYSGKQVSWINSSGGTFADGDYTYSSGSETTEMHFFYPNWNGYIDSKTKFPMGKKSEIASKLLAGNSFVGIDGTATSDANATAGNILKDKTAYVNGSKVTGAMANKSGSTIIASTITESGANALISIPANGYYTTGSKLQVPVETIKQNISATNPETINLGTFHIPLISQSNNSTIKLPVQGYSKLTFSFDTNHGYCTPTMVIYVDGNCVFNNYLGVTGNISIDLNNNKIVQIVNTTSSNSYVEFYNVTLSR